MSEDIRLIPPAIREAVAGVADYPHYSVGGSFTEWVMKQDTPTNGGQSSVEP